MAPGEMFGKHPNLYRVVKICLLPSIFVIWILFTPAIDGRIILYDITQWLGDIILLIQSDTANVIGGIFFLIGHVFMIQFFDVDFKNIPITAYLLAIPPAVTMYSIIFPYIKFTKLGEYYAVIYCTVLNMTAFASLTRLSKYPFTHPSFLCSWIGYLFFIVSDAFLILNETGIVKKRQRIPIMSTYTIAQTLIAIGAILAEKEIVDINTYFA